MRNVQSLHPLQNPTIFTQKTPTQTSFNTLSKILQKCSNANEK